MVGCGSFSESVRSCRMLRVAEYIIGGCLKLKSCCGRSNGVITEIFLRSWGLWQVEKRFSNVFQEVLKNTKSYLMANFKRY